MSIANRREYLRQPIGRSPVDEFLQAMPIGGTRSGILGAAGRSGFSPADISSLTHWYDATEISGSDGDAIGAWADQEGTDDLTQATSSKKPTLKTGILNGKQILRFDGSDDIIQAATASDWRFLHDGSPFSVFIVTENTGDTNNFSVVAGTSQLSTSQVGITFARDDRDSQAANNQPQVAVLNGSTAVLNLEGTSEFTQAPHIVTVTHDTSNTPDAAARIDANQFATDNQQATPDTGDPEGAFAVGAGPGDASHWTGDVAEILIYTAALSTADRNSVESYLSDKWGIAI